MMKILKTLVIFLFECPHYATHRTNLAVKVIEILQRKKLNYLGNLLELYVCGHRSLNLIDNRNILLSTIKYIKVTHPSPLFPPPFVTIVFDLLFLFILPCATNLMMCHLPGWVQLILASFLVLNSKMMIIAGWSQYLRYRICPFWAFSAFCCQMDTRRYSLSIKRCVYPHNTRLKLAYLSHFLFEHSR